MTLTKAELADLLFEKVGLNKREAKDMVEAFFEEIWADAGFRKWFGCFYDIFTSHQANEIYAEFVRRKIRERVKDPAVGEKLVPKDHWTNWSHWLIWHGRRRCYARKPDCSNCEVFQLCPSGKRFIRTGEARPA